MESKEEKEEKEIIKFSTDGFSDYLFAVTKEKETEAETETEAATETETVTEAQTTEAESEIRETETKAAETEIISENSNGNNVAPISNENGDTQSKQAAVTLNIKNVGTKTDVKDLVLTAENIDDLQQAVTALGETAKIVITQTTSDGKTKDITSDTASVAINKNKITIKAAAVTNSKSIQISGLPINGKAEEGTVVPRASYTVNAGGNYVNSTKMYAEADYYTVYQDADGKTVTATDGAYTFPLEKDMSLTMENVYSVVTVSSSGSDKPDSKFASMKYKITPVGKTSPALTVTADGTGVATVKGLPAGKYTVAGEEDSIPKQYWQESKSKEITVDEKNNLTSSAAFSYKVMTLTLKATDGRTGNALANVKITVKKSDGTGKTLTTNGNGQVQVTGLLERGATFTITQTRLSGYYSATSSSLKSSKYTVNATGEDPTIAFVNQPTVLKVGVIDNISKTSPYAGSYISGATLVIQKDTEVLKTITTGNGLTEIVGLLDPGVSYKLIQTAAPAGYMVGSTTDSGSVSVGKSFSILASSIQEKTVQISDDTVKVLVTRKGYDSRTKVTKNGKETYEYANLKVLSGAKLEIRDKNGNVVKDRNGNAISWTSDSSGGHLVEGVLAANTQYTLVETSAPAGYDLATAGTFTTYKSGNQAAVSMQSKKTSGTIRVVMRASNNGSAIKVNGTFYCALFTDQNLTRRYTAAGVGTITMTTGQVYGQVLFQNIPTGVYYVGETDKNGNLLKDNSNFKVVNPGTALHMDTSKNLIAEITNNYIVRPADAQNVSQAELQESYDSEYADYGGSAYAAGLMAEEGWGVDTESFGGVETGDTTNVVSYVIALAMAAALLAGGVTVKKRKKQN